MIDDPLDIFLADFGEPVIIQTRAGDKEIRAIWDEDHVYSSIGEIELDTGEKAITTKAADVCKLVREDRLTRKDEAYRVVRVKPDGTGIAVVIISTVGANEDDEEDE